MIKYEWGYKCNECNISVGSYCKKIIPDAQIKKLILNGKTDLINGFVSTKDPSKTFKAKLTFNEQFRLVPIFK